MPVTDTAATGHLEIPLTRLQLHLQALEPVQLPSFSGSTWRGALGQALRRVVCVCPNTNCRACVMQTMCWYARLYDPTVDPRCTLLHGYNDAPRAFIPQPFPLGGKITQGHEVRLDLLLIGQAREAVPFLVQAVQRMAAHGIALGRGKMTLISWESTPIEQPDISPWYPPALPPQITMTLNTPLRLSIDNCILDPNTLEPRPLLTNLLRRLSLLACCHADKHLETDFKALAETAKLITTSNRQLEWFRWTRYSTSQHRHVTMDGVIGHLTFDLSQAPEWWPYLWAGQWLHIGKGVSMGMGRYTLTYDNKTTN